MMPPCAASRRALAVAIVLVACSPVKVSARTAGAGAAAARGRQLFVATTGDDRNPGTIDAPWRTIQKAMDSAPRGATVNIRAGTYRELLRMNVSGAPGSPITFQPYGFAGSPSCGGHTGATCPGERVVLDYASLGTLTRPRPALLVSGQRYVVVQGLVFEHYHVDGPMHVGIQIDGGSHHVEFRWNVVRDFRNVHPEGMDGKSMLAVFRAGWGATTGDDVTVADCAFLDSKTNMSEVISFDVGSANGRVERTWVSDTDGIALHCFRGAHHLAFRDNRVDWAGVRRDGSIWYPSFGPTGQGLYNDGCHDTVWERNVVTHSSYGMQSLQEPANPAQGLPAAGDAYNVIFRNNTVRDAMTGVTIGTWYSKTDGRTVHDTFIYNNTLYDCRIGFQVRPFDAATVRVRNNIVARSGRAFVNELRWDVGTAFDFNLYSGGGRGPDLHQVNLDPGFANPTAGDFSLLPRSPAVDAGDPDTTPASAGERDALGRPRFVGARIDIGAIEAATGAGASAPIGRFAPP
jgi:hypothetical protein